MTTPCQSPGAASCERDVFASCSETTLLMATELNYQTERAATIAAENRHLAAHNNHMLDFIMQQDDQIKRLQQIQKKLQTEVKKLKTTNFDLRTQLQEDVNANNHETLLQTIENTKKEMEKLRITNKRQQTQIANLKTQLSDIRCQEMHSRMELAAGKAEIDRLKAEIDRLHFEHNSILLPVDEPSCSQTSIGALLN